MSPRLSRAEQNDRNRALLLAAARRVFLERGYYAATLDQIADEAGFSKGAVYSRFASKADMFLALLEDRIAERAARNAQLTGELAGTGNFAALLDQAQGDERGTPGWRLLVTEFRLHAARDPELNRRYAALHARTVDGVARMFAEVSKENAEDLPFPPRLMAELWLAIETGRALEQIDRPGCPQRPCLAPAGGLVRGAADAQSGGKMTTATITDLELLRTRVSGAIGQRMPEHIGRLGWDAGRLAVHQRDRLRALLARAIADSPFHAGRLRGVDPDRFELADLARLPVMTKADMMENFDAATTDRRLTRDLVERHLGRSVTDPSLLFGDYVVLVSGGSSGQRGLFVQAWDEYAEFAASVTRRAMAATVAAAGGLPPEGLVIGMVGAGSPVHSSGLACVTATRPPVRVVSAPASLPVAEIVRRLNAAQPPNLLAYAAKLAELAAEQRDGRLKLNLRSVASFAEAISMPERIAVTEAFGVPVIDLFASTEGLVGHSEPGEAVLTFAGDTCIAECVDDEGRPVPDGTTSSKVLVTNLHNLTQPIIRYELTDRFTPAGTSGGGALRASVEGRSDDLFRYAEASVHPFVIGAPLLHAPAVREFQIRQTERGADIAAVIDGDFDPSAVEASVKRSLRQAGVASPQVRFCRVGALDRDPMTSKARRFIPLSARIP